MKSFKEMATRQLSLSPLMAGRTQLRTPDIIGKELTLIKFDFASMVKNGQEKAFPVMVFAEYPDSYYNGGTVLSNLCSAWANEFGGDIEAASDALEAEGGVKLRMTTAYSNGNPYTKVEIV